jgi:multicomponent Na+:H+ antiporter subunit G
MELIMQIIIFLFLAAGIFFFVVGVAGLLRLPDVYCRLHATTKCDTLGAGLILFSLALYTGVSVNSVKLLLMILFIWLTNPTASHIIAHAAYRNNEPTAEGTFMLDKTEGGAACD